MICGPHPGSTLAAAGTGHARYRLLMRLVVLVERLSAAPWSPARLAAMVASSLASRGHAVTLVADSIEHERDARAMAGVVVREGFCHRGRVPPLAFRRFVAAELSRLSVGSAAPPPEAVLSFSRLVPSAAGLLGGEDHGACPTLWVPLSRAARGAGRELLAQLQPPLNFESLLRRARLTPGRLGRTAVEAWAARTRAGGDEVALFSGGPPSPTVSHGRRAPTLADGPMTWLAPVRPLVALSATQAASVRARVRSLLRIGPKTALLLMPADRPTIADLVPPMSAVAGLPAGRAVLVAVVREPVTALRAAELAGLRTSAQRAGGDAPSGLRVLTLTHRFDALVAAAEIGLVATARPSPAASTRVRPVAATHTHDPARLIAQFLDAGLPVVARAGAPGTGLVAPALPLGIAPDNSTLLRGPSGVVVLRHDASSWAAALQSILPDATRLAASVAARATADLATMSPEDLVDALEQTLARMLAVGA